MCINDYLTVYRKDYTRQPITSLKKYVEHIKTKNIEFKDPIGESFKNYLCLKKCDDEPLLEHVDTFYERIHKDNPAVDFHFENKGLNKPMVEKQQRNDKCSVYEVEYCDMDKIRAYKKYMAETALVLSMDAVIPETTQRSGFREPKSLNSRVYEKDTLPPRPPNHLDPNYNVRKILNVQTGDSEYIAHIGKLGKEIIEHELLGKVEKL